MLSPRAVLCLLLLARVVRADGTLVKATSLAVPRGAEPLLDAPWPKWQRTAGNSGNLNFPLNPGCP